VCLLLSMSVGSLLRRSSCDAGIVAKCSSSILPQSLHHTLRGEAAQIPPRRGEETESVSNSQSYHVLGSSESTAILEIVPFFLHDIGMAVEDHVTTTGKDRAENEIAFIADFIAR